MKQRVRRRVCSRCGQPKPLTKYSRDARGRKGQLHSWCDDCRRDDARAYNRTRRGSRDAAIAAEEAKARRAEASELDAEIAAAFSRLRATREEAIG